MKPTVISARRWFDRQWGNTYHSVRVVFDDGSDKVAPFTYGYGDHFLHTAGVLLGRSPQNGPDSAYDVTSRWCRENGIAVEVVDVSFRRELHNHGREPRKPRARYPVVNLDCATDAELQAILSSVGGYHRVQRKYAGMIVEARKRRIAGDVFAAQQYEQGAERVYNVEMPKCYRW